MAEQYSRPSSLSGDPLLGVLRLVAAQSGEAGVMRVLAEAADVIGVTRITLSGASELLDPGANELRVRVAGTPLYLSASFVDPPAQLAIERLSALASSISLVLRLEAREREAERARFHVTLGRGVAGVVHDIVNPLSSLQLSIEAARDGIDVSESIEDALGSVHLVRSALDRLRRFTGVLSAQPTAIEVGPAIASALRITAFATRGVAEVVVRVSPGLTIWARAGELEHIIVNLVINAAHAVDGLGGYHHRITVSAAARGHDVVIDVHDTGPGVAPEHLEHLFDEGFTTKISRNGSGLGLSLCRDIVTKLGGTIAIKSPPEDGTRVTLTLPSGTNSMKREANPQSGTFGVHVRPLPNVLVIDADDMVARALVRSLHRIATVRTTASVDHGLSLMASEAFDLILCEHRPPHLDGLVIRREQALRWPDLTGRVVLMLVDPLVELPAGTRVITKPIDIGALKALVSQE